MEKTIGSKGQDALIELLIRERKAAHLSQEDLAKALGQTQPWVAHVESKQRRIDVVEFVILADKIGINASEALQELMPTILGRK